VSSGDASQQNQMEMCIYLIGLGTDVNYVEEVNTLKNIKTRKRSMILVKTLVDKFDNYIVCNV